MSTVFTNDSEYLGARNDLIMVILLIKIENYTII